ETVTSVPNNKVGSTVTYNATTGSPVVLSTWTYRNLVINGANTTFTIVSSSIAVKENLTLTAGTLDASSSNYGITVSSNWINNGGSFTAQKSTVTFNATTSAQTITSSVQPF